MVLSMEIIFTVLQISLHSPYVIPLPSLQMDLIETWYLFYKLFPVHRKKNFCNIRIEILTQLKVVVRLLLILII